jgi:hypothetical protein
MTAEPSGKDHHASAATFHEEAARHHREAARHFEFGKGWAHAAHAAFLAQGYAMYAKRHGDEAAKWYVEKHGGIAPNAHGSVTPMASKLPDKAAHVQTTPTDAAPRTAAAADLNVHSKPTATIV